MVLDAVAINPLLQAQPFQRKVVPLDYPTDAIELRSRKIRLHELTSAYPNVISLRRDTEDEGFADAVMGHREGSNSLTHIFHQCRYACLTRTV